MYLKDFTLVYIDFVDKIDLVKLQTTMLCWRISICAVLCVVSPDRISTCAGRSWSELDTARYARSTRARCYLKVRGIASNLACNLLTLLCQNPGTKKRIRDGKEQSEFCGGSMNLDGTLKNPPGPPKSKGDIKARDAASKAKLQAKEAEAAGT